MELVFATNNAHKLEEVRAILGDRITIHSLHEIGCFDNILEDGATLQANALIKASYVKEHYGVDCFADDTGLEVECLGGEPGVYSARYAGDDCVATRNINKLLGKMEGKVNRRARFRTVIALFLNGEPFFFTGEVYGNIALQCHGKGGFGYDSIFIPEGYDKTFAELDASAKNRISHRARALEQFVEFLHNKLQ